MSGQHFIRRIALLTALSLSVFGCATQVSAQQRVFAKMEPNRDNPPNPLVFDINIDASDNVAPNIVITRDNLHAFVAYAGSGAVISFSLETGDVLTRIDTGGKPQFATMLPDQRRLLVMSVLDNRIFLIDMDTSTLLATYTFPNAEFGFGSPITLSPDGSIGYISSTGTGEVIKFSTADGQELARLKGMESPAQITLSLDGSILMAVDAHSEELVFVDPSSMTRKNSLKVQDKSTTANLTIFNKAVLAPDGVNAIICTRVLNPSTLSTGLGYYFKVATGELIDTFSVGTEPAFTGLTPDGKYWYVLNQSSLTQVPVSDIKSAKELQIPTGAPTNSANIIFSPDSRYAYFPASNYNIVYQLELSTAAMVGQLYIGDNTGAILSQPATMAITPDGTRIPVLQFVSNNIMLLTSATELVGAKFVSSATQFTGISLVNLSSQPSKFTLIALDNFGQLITGTGITNPAEYTLAPNKQISLTVAQIFHFDDTTERIGWIPVFSEQSRVVGYLSTGNTTLNRLDGVPLTSGERLFDFIVPEVVRKDTFFAELNYLNPLYNQASYSVTYYGKDGAALDTKTGQPAYLTNRQPQVFGEQYITPAETTSGYLRITSDMGILFTEYYGTTTSLAGLNAINMAKYAGITKVYSPQFALIPGFKTILNVINGNTEAADVTVTLHAPDGKVLGQPYKTTLVKNAQLKDDLATLFKNNPEAVNMTGWLEVASTKDRVVGNVTFTDDAGSSRTGFVLSGQPMSSLIFPLLAQDNVYETGLALLNNNPNPAQVTLEVYNTDGGVDQHTSVTLAAGERTAVYLPTYFPKMAAHLSGNLRIHSTQPLYGFALINDRDFNFISAIQPLPLP